MTATHIVVSVTNTEWRPVYPDHLFELICHGPTPPVVLDEVTATRLQVTTGSTLVLQPDSHGYTVVDAYPSQHEFVPPPIPHTFVEWVRWQQAVCNRCELTRSDCRILYNDQYRIQNTGEFNRPVCDLQSTRGIGTKKAANIQGRIFATYPNERTRCQTPTHTLID